MQRELTTRTKAFAVRIIKLFDALPHSTTAYVLGKQLLRSGTSVGAHAREAYRSRSTAEVISKLEVALQELDETAYWIELLIEAEIMRPRRLQPLLSEIDELIAIIVASVRTMKRRRK